MFQFCIFFVVEVSQISFYVFKFFSGKARSLLVHEGEGEESSRSQINDEDPYGVTAKPNAPWDKQSVPSQPVSSSSSSSSSSFSSFQMKEQAAADAESRLKQNANVAKMLIIEETEADVKTVAQEEVQEVQVQGVGDDESKQTLASDQNFTNNEEKTVVSEQPMSSNSKVNREKIEV